MATIATSITERLRVAGTTGYITALVLAISEGIVVSGRPAPHWRLNLRVQETLRLHASNMLGSILRGILTDALVLQSFAGSGMTAIVRERLGLRGRLTPIQKVVVREILRVAMRQQISAHYRLRLTERLGVHDALGHGIGALLRERLQLQPTLARSYRVIGRLAERLGVHDALGHTLVLTVFVSDTVVLTPEMALRAILHGRIDEELEFVLDIVGPEGDTRTFALNVRTGAVSSYLNYDFNSFARSAGGTYVGAADDGLYELIGEDDAGETIVADIISGLVDFSSSYLTSIKAAYVAVRGEGTFFLRITEATGRVFTYKVAADPLRTARVDIGKGLRARFFTYELISTGQDFDLEGITFLPIQQRRRI